MISARRPTVDKLTGLNAAEVPVIVDENTGKDNKRLFFPVGNTGMEGSRLNLINIHCYDVLAHWDLGARSADPGQNYPELRRSLFPREPLLAGRTLCGTRM